MVWVDLIELNDEECVWVKSIYGVILFDEDEFSDIEVLVCYFEVENGDLYLCIDFFFEGDDDFFFIMMVVFILVCNILFLVYVEDLLVFCLVCMCVCLWFGFIGDYCDVLFDFYEIDVEYLVDVFEGIY